MRGAVFEFWHFIFRIGRLLVLPMFSDASLSERFLGLAGWSCGDRLPRRTARRSVPALGQARHLQRLWFAGFSLHGNNQATSFMRTELRALEARIQNSKTAPSIRIRKKALLIKSRRLVNNLSNNVIESMEDYLLRRAMRASPPRPKRAVDEGSGTGL